MNIIQLIAKKLNEAFGEGTLTLGVRVLSVRFDFLSFEMGF